MSTFQHPAIITASLHSAPRRTDLVLWSC